jgi:diguanylate cyclase (GGDEF)-like protein
MRVRPDLRTGPRLFLTYAVASLVPVLALGAVLTHGHRQDGAQRGLSSALSQSAVIEEMAIAPALSGGDLRDGLSTGEEQRLQDATDLAIFRGSVLRLRLRDFDGAVVFSDDGRVSGALPADHPDFEAAALGDARAAVDDSTEQARIRVLQPLIASASGRAVGVLELTLPYEAIQAEVDAATTRTFQRLGIGLGLLYVVLGLISWSTTRRLSRHADRAAHDAVHDPLTGLGNRELFRRKVESATRAEGQVAVVLVDLDRFKQVNDTLGHHAGDELLRCVGRRMVQTLRTDDTVARLGGDEFGLVLPGIGTAEAARSLLDRVVHEVTRSIDLDGVQVSIEASFGVALHPRDGTDGDALLRAADAAMYEGKRGTTSVVVYDPELATSPTGALNLQTELRRALEQDELVLHYQPVVDLASGTTTRLEALVRWQHPDRGLVPPAAFLPTVEQSGLIEPFTRWVLERALRDCATWTGAGATWDLSVNVSARNLHDGLAAAVLDQLAAAGVDRGRLLLEVTETALAVDASAAARVLEQLDAAGVRTALDDFGVGYASLSHLRSLALHEVKIDRAFVAEVETSTADREVVSSLVTMAHGLGLTVTAEGVETEQAARWLRDLGCDSAQGYWYSRPAPWPDLLASHAVPSPQEALS